MRKLTYSALAFGAWLGLAQVTLAQQNTQLIEGAKKEGEVVWYGTLTGGSIVSRLLNTFEGRYPFIKVRYLRLGGAGFLERVRSEARAGRFLWDIVTSEYIQFFELAKQIALAKYAAVELKNYPEVHKDPNGTWVSIYSAIATIAWNTQMIKPAEAPKDWKDLLESKWKGRKIGLPAEAFQWYGGMVNYMGDEAGRAFMKALAAQEPQTQQGYTNTSNLLAAGEFPVAITRAHRIEDFRTTKGAPVDWSADANPIIVSTHPVGISQKAPHPAAARLFYDFLISLEGQRLFTEEAFLSSHSGVKSRFPRMTLERIKHPAPPDVRVSERIQTWITEYQQTFRIQARGR